MFRLVETDLASTGKAHLRNQAPSRFLDLSALNVLRGKGGHLGFQVFAYEIEFVGTIFFGRVESRFSRRQREDQPAMSRIHRLEPENVAEERAVRIGVFAVNNYVSARN